MKKEAAKEPAKEAAKETRVAIYARTSTANHGQDIDLQMDELRAVARQRGWRVTEFEDKGVSGMREARPGLDAMMAAVRAGEVDVVACWKFDRIARSTRHLLNLLDEFRRLKIEFVSLREAVSTETVMGRALFTLVACVSEVEHSLILERVAAGVARAREKGVRFGRPQRHVDVSQARRLLAAGRNQREVAVALHVPRTTLRRALERTPSGPKVHAKKQVPRPYGQPP